MWDRNSGSMRDVVMPGIGLYRTQAARSGEYAGMSEPEFGPDITEMIGEVQVTYPAWCKVAVMRRLPTGEIVSFPAKEFWKENYAVKGVEGEEHRTERDVVEATLRTDREVRRGASAAQGFPGDREPQPTAEEMEGKTMGAEPEAHHQPPAAVTIPEPRRIELEQTLELCDSMERLASVWKAMTKDERKVMEQDKETAKNRILEAENAGDEE